MYQHMDRWTGVTMVLCLLAVASACDRAAPEPKTESDPQAMSQLADEVVVQPGDWPCFRGTGRDGKVEASNWSHTWGTAGPTIVWKKDVGPGVSGMVIVAGRAFTMGNQGNQDHVYCLNASTGAIVWKVSYDCPLDARQFEGGPASTPCVADGRVYTLSHMGDLLCIDAKSGEVVWQKQLQNDYDVERPRWGFSSSPAVYDGVLYIDAGGAGRCTLAIDAATGKLKWGAGTEGNETGYCSPRIADFAGRPTLITMWGGSQGRQKEYGAVVGLDPASGEVLWRHPWTTSYGVNAAVPVITGDNTLFVSSGYNTGAAHLRIENGKVNEIWQSRVMRNKFVSSVYHDGHIYGFDERTLKCIDVVDGSVKWEDREYDNGALMLAGDRLVVIDGRSGQLHIIKATAKEQEVLATAQVLSNGVTAWVEPTFAHGFIYVRNNKGEIACVDVRSASGSGE